MVSQSDEWAPNKILDKRLTTELSFITQRKTVHYNANSCGSVLARWHSGSILHGIHCRRFIWCRRACYRVSGTSLLFLLFHARSNFLTLALHVDEQDDNRNLGAYVIAGFSGLNDHKLEKRGIQSERTIGLPPF